MGLRPGKDPGPPERCTEQYNDPDLICILPPRWRLGRCGLSFSLRYEFPLKKLEGPKNEPTSDSKQDIKYIMNIFYVTNSLVTVAHKHNTSLRFSQLVLVKSKSRTRSYIYVPSTILNDYFRVFKSGVLQS